MLSRLVYTVACVVYCAASGLDAAESLSGDATTITIANENAALAEHSKSADGRHALAWVPRTDGSVDWSLLQTDPRGFAEKYDVREIWVVDLVHSKKLAILGGPKGYVRPGSHRTLSVTWAPIDDGRRFALAAYDWKWGTDTLMLLDIGPDGCREAQIGPVLDRAIAAFIKESASPQKNGAYDTQYRVGELPERGHRTGFSGTETVRLPFATTVRGRDEPILEGIVTLKLSRTGGAPVASVAKIVAGLSNDPFADDTRLAKADEELNAVYTALSERLKTESRDILKAEQRRWLEQRDKKAVETKASAIENPRIVRDRLLRQLTEERTAELRARLKGER
jgi:hypothetical protein